jgi:hypothetical protein
MILSLILQVVSREESVPRIEIAIVIASEAKQSRHCALRLPRTLRVLAMTDKWKGQVVHLCSGVGGNPGHVMGSEPLVKRRVG